MTTDTVLIFALFVSISLGHIKLVYCRQNPLMKMLAIIMANHLHIFSHTFNLLSLPPNHTITIMLLETCCLTVLAVLTAAHPTFSIQGYHSRNRNKLMPRSKKGKKYCTYCTIYRRISRAKTCH